ncbi:MAG: hypothetical protein LBB40_06175 [Holophagales bacterium]|jgi:YHS domain-containing protein|nr:hypothetical protein [Holophagales bacterium]
MILPICLALFTTFAQEQEHSVPVGNTICPVLGMKVNEKSPVAVVKGRAYRTCCPPCVPKLEKNPDKYLNPDGTLKSVQEPKDQEHPTNVENTICPVLGQKVNEKSPTVVVKGRIYRICCPPCAPKLEKDPGKYLNPDGTLKKKK